MPKRKTRKHAELRQSKLADAIRAVQSLSKLHLSDSEARMLRLSFLDSKSPEWSIFADVQREIQARIEKTNWTRAKGALLVLLAAGQLEVAKAIDSFWPLSVAVTEEDKRGLFFFYLLKIGIARGDPYGLAVPCAYFYQARYCAVQEIIRRWPKQGQKSGHFGMWATPVLAANIMPADSGNLVFESAKIIGYAARVRRHTWDWLDLAPSTQVADTILSKWGGLEPYAAIAAGLDGKFNVVATATRHGTIDAIRKKKSNQALFEAEKILFSEEEGAGVDNPESKLIGNELLPRFRRGHPDEADLLKQIADGFRPADIAKETGQYVGDVEKLVRSAKGEFRQWYERQK